MLFLKFKIKFTTFKYIKIHKHWLEQKTMDKIIISKTFSKPNSFA